MNIQAVKSAEFKKYENEISVLKDEVSNLNFKVSSGSSLSLIENKAKKLGFTEVNSDIQVISTSYALNLSHEN
jgi:cell division protein FtsL